MVRGGPGVGDAAADGADEQHPTAAAGPEQVGPHRAGRPVAGEQGAEAGRDHPVVGPDGEGGDPRPEVDGLAPVVEADVDPVGGLGRVEQVGTPQLRELGPHGCQRRGRAAFL